MFSAETYSQRRRRLGECVESGMILFLGNEESPRNYRDNVYPFRQDSSFLYYWGIDRPGIAAVMDVDEGLETVFGDEPEPEAAMWFGTQFSLKAAAEKGGVAGVRPFSALEPMIKQARRARRKIHFLPQYRAGNRLKIRKWLDLPLSGIDGSASQALIARVVAQRAVKSGAEIDEIEKALSITRAMHDRAMGMTRPGTYEFEVVSAMESVAYASGGCRMAYAPIFTVRGEILHNQVHTNLMKDGDLAVNDAAAESPLYYAADITRTIPVSGKFDPRQREIYDIVLQAQEGAIQAMRPGIEFREIHRLACRTLTEGLQQLGLMKGDTEASVAEGAHALFFPHGIGHMMGLDVHDMESLGEANVGYSAKIQRSDQFGLANLRFARELQTGFVLTVEPGIYFIPGLMERWKAEGRLEAYIRYERIDEYKGFGGIRIEDDVLITDDGCRVLGDSIPKTAEAVEQFCRGSAA